MVFLVDRLKAFIVVVTMVMAVSASTTAHAQCPQSLCDCVANLAGFVTLGGTAKLTAGSYSDEGERIVYGTSIDGSACLETAILRGRVEGDGEIVEDLVLRAGVDSVAARLQGYREDGDKVPAFTIGGDLLTAGGSVKGMNGIDYDLDGSLLIGAADLRLSACHQAVLDAANVSAQFAAMPARQFIEKLTVDGNLTINAGPGVWTVNIATDLVVKKSKGQLTIVTDPATDLVVINVGRNLIVGNDGAIAADSPEAVVINLVGKSSKVKIGKRATVDVPILAANANVSVLAESTTANLWTTGKMILSGATVSDALVCDVPEQPAKIVFASSEEYDGLEVGGTSGADALCQQLASDAALSGTFKAWLSDNSTAAAARLTRAIVPYTLPDGTVVANNWNDLTDGTLLHAIDQDESEDDLDALLDNYQVWTATESNGASSTDGNCVDWTSDEDTEDGAIGDASAIGPNWTAADITTCDDFARLYCVQQ